MLTSWEDASKRLEGLRVDVPATKEVVGPSVIGGRLAEDIRAKVSNPPFRMSAMDGWAVPVCCLDKGETGLVIGTTVLAGMEAPGLAAGKTCAVMTGAPVPVEAGAVIPVEDARVEEGRLYWKDKLTEGQNIRAAAEDFAFGDVLLKAGTTIAPHHLLMLRAGGVGTVSICGRIPVALIQTGDELCNGVARKPGFSVYESTRACLLHWLRKLGGGRVAWSEVHDTQGGLRKALEDTLAEGQRLIVTTGGVSKGVADFVPAVAASLGGEVLLHRLAIKPSKPLLVVRFPNGAVLVGLPGNPVSQVLGLQAVVAPLLRCLQPLKGMETHKAKLEDECGGRTGFRTFLRAVVRVSAEGRLVVRPLSGNESHRVSNLADCNAWIHVTGRHEAGSLVEVSPFVDTHWNLAPCRP
ncbi:molybdopterin molybdotransferase MoeA [Hyphomicrobium zavarzinii]|uniref:molybdopterin molybdotransferase MoeA n=1 Tax=Hyphomicrobium zavarzinii TaxID=48292 RepID=UPI00058E06FE|nr:molybdopterin molybdotransferase MoeA [Hyphomicrobium zavarzinii]